MGRGEGGRQNFIKLITHAHFQMSYYHFFEVCISKNLVCFAVVLEFWDSMLHRNADDFFVFIPSTSCREPSVIDYDSYSGEIKELTRAIEVISDKFEQGDKIEVAGGKVTGLVKNTAKPFTSLNPEVTMDLDAKSSSEKTALSNKATVASTTTDSGVRRKPSVSEQATEGSMISDGATSVSDGVSEAPVASDGTTQVALKSDGTQPAPFVSDVIAVTTDKVSELVAISDEATVDSTSEGTENTVSSLSAEQSEEPTTQVGI